MPKELIMVEAEDFCHGWSILPVLFGREADLRQAFKKGLVGWPGTQAYSGGRYRYSGTILTGVYPIAEIEFPVPGDYLVWARSKYYAGENKGTYTVAVGPWVSREFGGVAAGPKDRWTWQVDRMRIKERGKQVVRLIDTRPEACCDVVLFTNDLKYRPDDIRPLAVEQAVSAPYTESAACREEQLRHVRVREIQHGVVHAYHGYFGDVNQDGKDEILLPFEDGYVETFNGEGRSLWRCPVALPWHRITRENYREQGFKYYIEHDFRPNCNASGYHVIDGYVADINQDGVNEFVFGWNPLYVIEARTGRIRRERRLPGQGARVALADLSGKGKKTEIVAVTKDAVDGRAFVHALNADLETIWMTRVEGPDMEHEIAVGDLDADGRDEIAFTVSNNLYCLDATGAVRWVHQGRAAWHGIDFHSDHILIETIDADPARGGVVITSEGTIFNSDGSVRWRGDRPLSFGSADYLDHVSGRKIAYPNAVRAFDHGQMVMVAKIRDDYPGKQILFGERNIGNIYCYGADGHLIWERGRYYGRERVHVSDIVSINWSGKGKKEILCRYLGVLDQDGNVIAIPPFIDCGSANLSVANISGGTRDDIVVTIGKKTLIISPVAESAASIAPERPS